MKLNPGNTEATLRIDKTVNAQALDNLIGELAELRTKMLPAVAATRPSPNDPESLNTHVTMEDAPAMRAYLLKDGRIRLWARSAGFGWLAFTLNHQDALIVRDYLIASLPPIESDLISQSNSQRH